MKATQPHARRVCGATTRAGTPCQRAPLAGRTRCALHGGKTPRGVASPHFVTGRRSKDLPTRLAARYGQALADPDLLALRDEIALTDALLADALAGWEAGGSGAVFTELARTWGQWQRWQALGRTREMAASREELGRLIARGTAQQARLDAVVALLDQRRKLVEAESKRLVQMRQMVTAEQAMTFVAAVVEAVKTHVHDRETLARISADLDRLAHREDGSLDC